MKTRILSVIVMLPLLLGAIFHLSVESFSIILLCVVALAAYEWAQLCGISSRLYRFLYVVVLLFCSYCLILKIQLLYVLLLGLLSMLYLWVGVLAYQSSCCSIGLSSRYVRAILGVLVLSSSWLAMIFVRTHEEAGARLFTYTLLLVWSVDIGGYFFGRFYGKRPLVSRVSPKKTWEGFWAGVICALLVAIFASFYLPITPSMQHALWAVSFVVIISAVLGDLSISVLKRIANVKDSGNLIPGHGGILDRIDSVMPAFIVMSLGLILINY